MEREKQIFFLGGGGGTKVMLIWATWRVYFWYRELHKDLPLNLISDVAKHFKIKGTPTFIL